MLFLIAAAGTICSGGLKFAWASMEMPACDKTAFCVYSAISAAMSTSLMRDRDSVMFSDATSRFEMECSEAVLICAKL